MGEQNKNYDSIYNEGYYAFRAGVKINNCPYLSGTTESDKWIIGWYDAQDVYAYKQEKF